MGPGKNPVQLKVDNFALGNNEQVASSFLAEEVKKSGLTTSGPQKQKAKWTKLHSIDLKFEKSDNNIVNFELTDAAAVKKVSIKRNNKYFPNIFQEKKTCARSI